MAKNDTIEIRIAPDGRLFIDGCTAELLEIAAAICPNDPAVLGRMKVLEQTRANRQALDTKEQPNGNAAPGR